MEARCVTADIMYGRTQLYPGWSCLLDLDCASKKCFQGKCIGRQAGETCSQQKDCVSGTFCKLRASKPVCTPMIKYNMDCVNDYECGAGLFCMGGKWCEKFWYKDDEAIPRDMKQCKSGLIKDDKLTGVKCKSTKAFKYGPFINSQTNVQTWADMINPLSTQCGFGDQAYSDSRYCLPLY